MYVFLIRMWWLIRSRILNPTTIHLYTIGLHKFNITEMARLLRHRKTLQRENFLPWGVISPHPNKKAYITHHTWCNKLCFACWRIQSVLIDRTIIFSKEIWCIFCHFRLNFGNKECVFMKYRTEVEDGIIQNIISQTELDLCKFIDTY